MQTSAGTSGGAGSLLTEQWGLLPAGHLITVLPLDRAAVQHLREREGTRAHTHTHAYIIAEKLQTSCLLNPTEKSSYYQHKCQC